MNNYGSRFSGEPPPKKGTTNNNFQYASIIKSLYKELPGDVEKFHQIHKILNSEKIFDSKNPDSKPFQFNYLKHLNLIDCAYDRTIPFFGRAYLGSDNNIYLCGNTTWKLFLQNDRRSLQNLVLHEMIHLYDRKIRDFDFRRPDDLACSEIRAYAMSSNCNGSRICIMQKTDASLSASHATQFMEPLKRTEVIAGMLDRCLSDQNPFVKNEAVLKAPSKSVKSEEKKTTPK